MQLIRRCHKSSESYHIIKGINLKMGDTVGPVFPQISLVGGSGEGKARSSIYPEPERQK